MNGRDKYARSIKRSASTQALVNALREWLGLKPLYSIGPKPKKKAERESRKGNRY